MNSPEGQRQANQQETGLPIEKRIVMITPRDQKILTGRAQGITIERLSPLIYLSRDSIKTACKVLNNHFGTASLTETVKQAIRLGTVTDVLSISAKQMNSLSPQERYVLKKAYEHKLQEEPVPQLAGILHVGEATIKTHLTNTYHKLDTHSLLASVARYARTIEPPAQHDTIVCIKRDNGTVTEAEVRLLETFVQIVPKESEEQIQQPDHVKHAFHVLRNGGTIDLNKQPFHATTILGKHMVTVFRSKTAGSN